MTAIDEALPAGTHVSGYVIERVLGQGGFAFTYLAHDEHLTGSKFALKEFYPGTGAAHAAGADRADSGPGAGLPGGSAALH